MWWVGHVARTGESSGGKPKLKRLFVRLRLRFDDNIKRSWR